MAEKAKAIQKHTNTDADRAPRAVQSVTTHRVHSESSVSERQSVNGETDRARARESHINVENAIVIHSTQKHQHTHRIANQDIRSPQHSVTQCVLYLII